MTAALQPQPGNAAPDAAAAAQATAARAARAMWAGDQAARALGMEIVAVAPGCATLCMRIRPDMANGHGICHGGLIFALADTAFAYACNSFNRRTVAAGADIEFIAPAHPGDTLTARAVMRQQGERNGLYDVSVENQAGTLLALFRGRARRIRGHLVENPDAPDLPAK